MHELTIDQMDNAVKVARSLHADYSDGKIVFQRLIEHSEATGEEANIVFVAGAKLAVNQIHFEESLS